MAKRFLDSSLWDKDWFLDLSSKYKVLWVYMITKCDTAGIFDPNLKNISKMLNEKYNEEECLMAFNGKVIKVLDKWVLVKFIEFQYGSQISPTMIDPINKCLSKIGHSIDSLSILYNRTMDSPVYMVKDKDKEKIKEGTQKLKYLEFVFLSQEEYEKLISKFGKEAITAQITSLNNYIGSKGKRYKSHYHTILTWINKNGLPIITQTQKKIDPYESTKQYLKELEGV